MTTTPTIVLVVDQQPDQIQTLRRGLLFLSIASVTARTTREAVSYLERPEGAHVSLMITDVTALAEPVAELIARARGVRPGLPVLVIAGLTLSPSVVALRASGVPLLQKPFTPRELGRAITNLLCAPAPTT